MNLNKYDELFERLEKLEEEKEKGGFLTLEKSDLGSFLMFGVKQMKIRGIKK